MLVSYNWLKDYLGPEAPTPEHLAELLTFHAFEIESLEARGQDTVIDVKILPDRSSDCLCHRGIAREVASITGVPLAYDPLAVTPELPPEGPITITIEDSSLCPRFTVALIEGITVGPSPQWLVERLAALGQRSINNIVDATNYVMYALGQPMHAYDADAFGSSGSGWSFAVRAARVGEEVALLAEGGKEGDRVVILKGGELLVTEATTGTAVGLAGVKGGRYAGVHSGTTRILLEAAHFNPARTRKTARGLGIVIDASKRFENEPSRNLPPYAQAAAIALIAEIAGGTATAYVDTYPAPATNPTVVVSPVRVNALLGITLSVDEIAALLIRAGITVTKEENLTLTCCGPLERTDLQIEEDFIEEVGRLFGYHHVTSVVPAAVPLAAVNARQYYTERIRTCLLERGFTEVMTSSFVAKAPVALQSSLASDKTCLRDSLMPNLVQVLDRNAGLADLLGLRDIRVFEIGAVFNKGAEGIAETLVLGMGVRQKVSGYTPKDDALLATVVAELEAALGVTLVATTGKGVVEVNLTAMLSTVTPPEAYEPVVPSREFTVAPYSLYPAVSRDIAMWVPEGTEVAAVAAVLDGAAGPLRVRTTHVDAFTKDGRTSLAFRLVFQASDRTLTDEAVNVEMERVYEAARAAGFETR